MAEAKYRDPCEWSPRDGRAAYADEVHAKADVIVGADGQWRLCESCAALPHFKRFRTRRPIATTGNGGER